MFGNLKSIYWQQVVNRKVTNSSVENVFFMWLLKLSCFAFSRNEPQGNSTLEWLYDCHNDRWVTKMKNCISGVCLRYIWSFLILFIPLTIVSSLTAYAQLLCVLSFTHHLLFSSLTLLCFDSPALVPILYIYLYICFSCYPVCLTLSTPPSSPRSLPISSPFLSFCPCLSKECFSNRMLLHNSGHYANLSFIQCIKKMLSLSGQNKSPLDDIHKKGKTHEEIYLIF